MRGIVLVDLAIVLVDLLSHAVVFSGQMLDLLELLLHPILHDLHPVRRDLRVLHHRVSHVLVQLLPGMHLWASQYRALHRDLRARRAQVRWNLT